jgi:large conductance mechanosensitive channel
LTDLLKEFCAFILRGNLVDLAVAVVIGTAFTAMVNAFVSSLVTPLIAAVGGKPDFADLDFTINGSRFAYGRFFNALLTRLIVAAVIFFLVVRPVNALMARMRTEPHVESQTRDCPECLSAIPIPATRCRSARPRCHPHRRPRDEAPRAPVGCAPGARSSVDRALASGARGRRFESCRARWWNRSTAAR